MLRRVGSFIEGQLLCLGQHTHANTMSCMPDQLLKGANLAWAANG